MEINDLKRRPFCGGEADCDEELNSSGFQIFCSRCLASTDACRTKDEAISDWNTRHSPWISVKDRLPHIIPWEPGSITGKSIPVLIYKENFVNNTPVDHRPFDVGVLRKGGRGDLTSLYWDAEFTPTHWMPLPEPPKT